MRRRLPPLNSLKAFEAAARYCSFSDAADELCVSHSAVSHQVKLLEKHLNIELFVRKPHSVTLSAAGKQLYPYLRDGFNGLSEGVERVLAPQAPSVLTVRLYNTFAIRWLIPNLTKFQRDYPDIQVRLSTSLTDVDFDHDDVDVCIRSGKTDDPGVHYDRLFGGESFPVCSPAYLEKNPNLKQPSDLLKHTIIQVTSCPDDWFNWLSLNNISDASFDSSLEFDSYDLALTTAAQGLGVAMTIDTYAKTELETGVLIEPFPDFRKPYPLDWYLASRRDRHDTKKIQLFRQWMLEEAKAFQ